jgi:hypothetical protein
MSSPIHHPEDLDAALIYAPPWAREQGQPEPLRPSTALIGLPQRRRRLGSVGHAYSGDLAMAKLQRQLALDPDKVPEPPLDDVQLLWPIMLRLCGVAAVAAAVAWLVVALPSAKSPRNESSRNEAPRADVASTPIVNKEASDPLHSPAAVELLVQHGLAQANMPAMPPEMPPLAAPQVASIPASANIPPSANTPPSADAPTTDDKRSPLDRDEIAVLVKRGKDFLTNGDLASARLLLQRAAEAGSADAAMALGATFDPLVIRRLGAIGAAPDTARARQWYQKAVALGAAGAAQPLAKLEAAAQ